MVEPWRMCATVSLLIAVALCAPPAAGLISCSTFQDKTMSACTELAPNAVLQWAAKDTTITLNVSVQAPGVSFLALGLSETGSMKGADYMVLSGSSGKWSLTDMHAKGFEMPEVDSHQDLALRGVYQDSKQGVLSVKFSRKLAPCDQHDLIIRKGGVLYVQYAYGPRLGYHGPNRGSKLLELYPAGPSGPKIKSTGVQEESGSSAKVIDLVMSPLTIPARETSYVYQWFKVPADKKYHILAYRPRLGSTGDKFNHHAVVYACDPSLNPKIEGLANKGPTLSLQGKPRCNTFYMVAIPHSPRYSLPPEAGLPFGKGSYTWMMLELHFNNPGASPGVQDQGSGISMEVSEQLRPHDMGLLTLAQVRLAIPPGLSSFSAPTSYCLAQCTGKMKQRVTLVDQTYHMHSLGRSAVTRRFRGNRELSPLGQLRSFDFNYQPVTPVPAEAQVLEPGDTLSLTCTFDSSSRTSTTLEGPGARDEMCFHYVYYWPAQPSLAVCSSFPATGFAPEFGVCAPSEAPLRALEEDPSKGMDMVRAGILLHVNKPTRYNAYKEACTDNVAT